jgi:hypothetical protein
MVQKSLRNRSPQRLKGRKETQRILLMRFILRVPWRSSRLSGSFKVCPVNGYVDTATEPACNRMPMMFKEVYIAHVTVEDFRKNPRGELGTRTATLHRDGVKKLRENWIYRV